jgi:23S rRNA pseudouridine1911/1915/1917 synthase
MSQGRGFERLDVCLVRLGLAASRRAARDLIAGGQVRVNGRALRKGEDVAADDKVELTEPPAPLLARPPSTLDIPVLFLDDAIIVVNKPGLIPCHPLRATDRETVLNAIALKYPETAIDRDRPFEGGLVHRLDNGTSGALIIARTAEAFAPLRAAIRGGAIEREYRALVAGKLDTPQEISTPIAHHLKNPRKMVTGAGRRARSHPRPAFSRVLPLSYRGGFTLVKVLPLTGNRHQIRIHLASIGHPIAGDMLYGGPAIAGLAPDRLWLHLTHLDLDSPAGGRIRVAAPLAPDLETVLGRLRTSSELQR